MSHAIKTHLSDVPVSRSPKECTKTVRLAWTQRLASIWCTSLGKAMSCYNRFRRSCPVIRTDIQSCSDVSEMWSMLAIPIRKSTGTRGQSFLANDHMIDSFWTPCTLYRRQKPWLLWGMRLQCYRGSMSNRRRNRRGVNGSCGKRKKYYTYLCDILCGLC